MAKMFKLIGYFVDANECFENEEHFKGYLERYPCAIFGVGIDVEESKEFDLSENSFLNAEPCSRILVDNFFADHRKVQAQSI